MIAASYIAAKRGIIDEAQLNSIEEVLKLYDFECRVKLPDNDTVWGYMQKDKKKLEGKLKFVLPTKIGEVMQTTDVTQDEVYAAFEYISL
jgi:3-dehydroquinate synthetase